MSNHQIELDWTNPYTFRELLSGDPQLRSEWDDKAGVYLHVEQSAELHELLYVGKATGRPSLWTRQVQHYTFLIGGQDCIPSRWRAESRPGWVMGYGKRTDPQTTQRTMSTLFDVESFVGVVRDGFRFAAAHRIYLANVADSALVRKLEAKLLHQLRPSMTGSQEVDPHPDLEIVHRGATWNVEPLRSRFRTPIHESP